MVAPIGCQRSSKADTLNKDRYTGRASPWKAFKECCFHPAANMPLLLPPGAPTLPAASPLSLGAAGSGDH